MRRKKLMAAVLAGAMALSLAACGGTPAPGDGNGGGNGGGSTPGTENAGGENAGGGETAGGDDAMQAAGIQQPNTELGNTQTTDETIVVGLASEPAFLWHVATEGSMSTNEEQIISAAFLDRLVDLDKATGEVVPMLATSWDWVDGTHLKFYLREDVTMSDGTPLVADDVVYTVGLWTTNCATNDTGKYMVGAVADDEHTVTIEFNVVAPDIVKMLSWGNFGIVSEDEVNAAGGLAAVATNPVIGSGKYRFKEWKTGEYIILERNDSYWNPDYKGYFKEIKFTFTSDAAAREMAVESGDAQVALDMPVSQASTFAGNTAIRTYIHDFGQETHLWYNMGENAGPTKDARVRAAIDKALNFDAIAQVGTAGYGQAALSYVGSGASYYTPGYTPEERAVDIEGAKALLADAGYADGLELTAIGLQDINDVLTVMQSNLAEAGIKLNISISDTGSFVEAALFTKEYDLICVGDDLTIRTPQMDQFVTGGMVIGGPNTPLEELAAAFAVLREETDESKLAEEGAKIDALIKEETICSNLYLEMHATVTAADLKGYCTRERGYTDVTMFYK